MRVLHVDPERGWGGGQVQVLGLLRGLAAQGVTVELAADPEGRLAAAARGVGVTVHPLRIRNHADLRAGAALRRLARGYDIVHFHTARAHALAPFVGFVRRIVTRRMDYVPAGGPYARWLYNQSVDRVIAISAGVRSALLQAGVRADRIRVVPSGVEPSAWDADPAAARAVRAAWNVSDRDTLALQVGALETRKGHAVVLQAAERIRAQLPQLRYVFCGDGSARAALAATVAAQALPVQLVGFRTDIPACLAAADVFLLPSLQEGLGVAALEAMAAGRAVIGSRVGGLGEVIVDGETGLLVPPGDATALAAAIITLAGDPARRQQMGRAGAARVAAHYTMARMAAGTLACYEERP